MVNGSRTGSDPSAPADASRVDRPQLPWYFLYQLIKATGKFEEVEMANMTLNDARPDETFAALANSTRRAILARLAEGRPA